MAKNQAYAELNESGLLAAAKSGDQKAFRELVRRYEDTVFRFSVKLCRNREQAEETLQDTFINVFRKLHTFDGRSKFSTWLYTIVANNCLMKQRRTKRDLLEDSLEELDTPPTDQSGKFKQRIPRWEETPSDILQTKELRTLLDGAMAKLPEMYRAVFVLRDVEGRTTEETAEILSITIEASKSRLRRARAFLREQLNPYMTSEKH